MQTLITCIICLPFTVAFVLILIYPEESVLSGRRWMFDNDDLEPSDSAVKINKVVSIIGLIIIAIVIILSIFSKK